MVPLLYIFPIVFVILATIAFFIDLDEAKGKMIFMGMSFVFLILLIGNETTVFLQVKNSNTLAEKVAQSEDWKTGQIARMNTILASMSSQNQSEKQKLADLATLGWSSNNTTIQDAYAAEAARLELLEYTPPPRHNVVIENLPQSIDKMLVSFTLEEMGFIVRANQTQEQYKNKDGLEDEKTDEDEEVDEEVDEDNEPDEDEKSSKKNKSKPKKEINALHFGHLVRNNDIKLILYTMIRAGVPIRQVKVFRKQSKENARHVNFGYSKSYEKRTRLTVDKIKKTKLFKR